MPEASIIGNEPALRVSVGDRSLTQGRELLHTIRESDTPVAAALVGSTGHIGLEPLVMATYEGKTTFFSRCPIERVGPIIEGLEEGSLPVDDALAVTDHEPGVRVLPTPDDGPLAVGEREVLGACGWAVPASIEDYMENGPCIASTVDEAGEPIARLRAANLRGRGRGDVATDAPIADHWETAKSTDATGIGGAELDPAVVVNANEADPRAEMDRLLLESDPISVLDAAMTAAIAIDATNVVVYLNDDDSLARDRVGEAAAGLSDEVDAAIPIEVLAGPDEYKAGEMTMAIEALEGNHRIEARLRPPYPSEEGLYGRPTLVHTPRTLAQVSLVLRKRDELVTSSDPGTRLFTVAGDVREPATVELSTDEDLNIAQDAVDFDGPLKAACIGGVFGGLTRSLDIPARANALTAADLGTNGVIELLDDQQCMVSFAGHRASFAEEENCGRCVPCREGTQQLADLLRDVYEGTYQSETIRELMRIMTNSSICHFGQAAPRPVRSAMDEFEPEFRAHANGNCSTGECK